MRPLRPAALLFLLPLCAVIPDADAAVTIEIISVSPPQNSGQVMHGFGAAIVRVRSAAGNILGVDFDGQSASGQPLGFFGRMGQRWTSSQHNGVYDEQSPGFLPQRNSGPSPLNFDSHFLGDPAHFNVVEDLKEGNVLFPDANPIPSDPIVGYGLGRRFGTEEPGFLTGAYEVLPKAQSPILDVAYVVNGGAVLVQGEVVTDVGTFGVQAFLVVPDVPEPSLPLLVGCCTVVLLRSRLKSR